MIRLLDLPGVSEIETRMTLNDLTGVRQTDHDLERMIEKLIRVTLGVQGQIWDYWEIVYGDYATNKDSEVAENDNDDEITSWLKEGFDIRGEDGAELRCLERIGWALEVVDAGRGGRSKIEIEADIWKRGKALEAANQNRPPKHSEYLQFGGRRPRRT